MVINNHLIIRMKNLFLIALSQMFVIAAFCQPEMKTELLTETTIEDADISSPWLDIPFYILLENSGTEAASIKWEYYEVDPEACITGWETYGCDNNNCYGPDVTSNVNPNGGGPNNPSIIEPGESYEFAFHFRPRQIAGCCTINLDFSYTSTPNDIFSSIEIPIMLNDPTCQNISTSVEDLEDAQVDIYPTITEDMITIECNPNKFKAINLLSANGELINKYIIDAPTISISLSEYTAGAFFIELIGEETSSIQRIFLTK